MLYVTTLCFRTRSEQVAYGPSNILVSLGAGTHATNADAVEDWYLKVAGKAFTRL